MKYLLFLGCNIPARVQQYHDAAGAVCKKLNIELTLQKEFMCCGYPMRNIDEFVFLVCAARNIAIAESGNQDMMVLCKCCYGSLKTAVSHINNDNALKNKINKILNKEGLVYTGDISIKHFLSVLYKDIGVEQLKSNIKTKYKKLNIAASVGCHALRPAKITEFDIPASPSLFDTLVKITGATAIDWSKKSGCCGAPLVGINNKLSQYIMKEKLADAIRNKADFIAVACPYSFIQFDTVQKQVALIEKDWHIVPPVLYPQLLGLAMGISPARLGLDSNTINISSLEEYLSQEMLHA